MDSLVCTNDEEELFPNGGRFAVFSLSKLFRIPYGAICVCHNADDYEVLKEARDNTERFCFEKELLKNASFADVIIEKKSNACCW